VTPTTGSSTSNSLSPWLSSSQGSSRAGGALLDITNSPATAPFLNNNNNNSSSYSSNNNLEILPAPLPSFPRTPIDGPAATAFLKRTALKAIESTLMKRSIPTEEKRKRLKKAKAKVNPLADAVLGRGDEQKIAMAHVIAAHQALAAEDMPGMLSALGCDEEPDDDFFVLTPPDSFAETD
jgi:hypothetical protein